LLDGSGQQPSYRPVSAFAYYLSRLCEEFPGRLPTELLAEKGRLPDGLLEEIIASRSYARALAANQVDPKGWNSSPMRITANEIAFELAQEEIDGR